jgi:hypothetical protein
MREQWDEAVAEEVAHIVNAILDMPFTDGSADGPHCGTCAGDFLPDDMKQETKGVMPTCRN